MLYSGLPRKEKVVALMKCLETGDMTPANSYINKNNYRQHNLSIPNGFEGFVETMNALSEENTKVTVVRAFRDNNYVFVHSELHLPAPMVGFDVFKFEGEKIVEHWDNLQTLSRSSVSGRTQLDGPTDAIQLEKTEANKLLVEGFVKDVLYGENPDQLTKYLNPDVYMQHNPEIGDGFQAVVDTLTKLSNEGTPMVYQKTHLILGEGNFVLCASEGLFSGKPAAFYDLFRVENNKIVEHWDTIESIPEKSQWKNQNGKF